QDRRERTHISEEVPFRTKPRIAAELVRNLDVTGTVALDWVVADSEYGRAGHFLDELEQLGRRYVLEVPVSWVFWAADPAASVPAYSGRGRKPTVPERGAARTAAEVAAELPPSAWTALRVREGALGPLVFEFAAVRAWGIRHRKPGPPSWLLIRRSLGADPEFKYYVSNADAETPLSTLALVACTRCRVEEFFEDCKSHLGMAQYETRSWIGWHHHMTLVGLAHLFVTVARRRLQKKCRS
ncbi:MAG TPA: transposase, partial [Gemmatimonadales bacterium]|nr:transposase [Gemmatimonadales bacterium]